MLWSSTCHGEMDISMINQSLLSDIGCLNVWDELQSDWGKTETFFSLGKSVDFRASYATYIAAVRFNGLKFVAYAAQVFSKSPSLMINLKKNICADSTHIFTLYL